MSKYKFVFSNGFTHNEQFLHDLDAMQHARELLSKMRVMRRGIHYVHVWCVVAPAKYIHVASYGC